MAVQDRDYFTDKASKMFGVPYEKVTEVQRLEAKNRILDYIYGRSDSFPFNSEVD